MDSWILSDTHFGHKSILVYEKRPFRDVAEMEEVIIKNWNAVVKKDDMVYHLGDFGFYPKDILAKVVASLNGRITLIKGNHDNHSNKWFRDIGFREVIAYPIIIHGTIILSHEPVYLGQTTPYVNIHGHVHGSLAAFSSPRHINVCVERTDYKPVQLGPLLKKIFSADFGEGLYEDETSDE